jgi:hypothetical protein
MVRFVTRCYKITVYSYSEFTAPSVWSSMEGEGRGKGHGRRQFCARKEVVDLGVHLIALFSSRPKFSTSQVLQ